MNFLDSIIQEFQEQFSVNPEIAIENFNTAIDNNHKLFTEAEYNKKIKHLRLEVMPVDKFVKVNDCKEITNPVFFEKNGTPTDDGFLSNKIFGITREERAGIYAYIDLGQYYLDPSCYKNWTRIDKNIKACIAKTEYFSIDDKGYLTPDPNGKNGIKFIKDNIDKIKFKRTDSHKRDMRVDYLEYNRKSMFINKYIVIPPYYRDVNTGRGGTVGIDGINKLYQRLLLAVQSLKATQEYGFDMSGAMELKVQEIILAIYDWACGNSNNTVQVEKGIGLGQKFGILRRAAMNKTSNYSARLVISAPEVKVFRPEDLMADMDHAAVPLYACIACLRPFIIFWLRRFFENEFVGTELYPVIDSTGEIKYIKPKDPLIEFSDERFVNEIEKFIHAYNDRFNPITITDSETGKKYFMRFKGGRTDTNGIKPISLNSTDPYSRRLTWCDLLFMAAVDQSKDKNAMITRYPIDKRSNIVTTGIRVSSTTETIEATVNHQYYKYYPKITEKEIDTDTDTKFVDVCKMSNVFMPGMMGDYDGDTISLKIPYTIESNQELSNHRKSKSYCLNLDGINIKQSENDCIQSLYVITKVLNNDKDMITEPQF